MEFFWVFMFVVLAAVAFLNVMGTNIIMSSQFHDHDKKKKLLFIVWGVPIVGMFIAMMRINKDIKRERKKMEEDIAPAIRELANRIKVLEADIQHEQDKKSIH